MKKIDANKVIKKLSQPAAKKVAKTIEVELLGETYEVKVYDTLDLSDSKNLVEISDLIGNWFSIYLSGLTMGETLENNPLASMETEDLFALVALYVTYGMYTDLVLPSEDHSIVDLILFMGALATEGIQGEIIASLTETAAAEILQVTQTLTTEWANLLSETLEAESLE